MSEMLQSHIERLAMIQRHFDFLDQSVSRLKPRDEQVMALPKLDRDLYFVFDLIGVTGDSGMGAWVHYHIDDKGWIDDASRAYVTIGHPDIAADLLTCRQVYQTKTSESTNCDDHEFNCRIWNKEELLIEDLHSHLTAHRFQFHNTPMTK